MERKRFVIQDVDLEMAFIEVEACFIDDTWEKETIYYENETLKMLVIVVERYFMRNNSSASATYTIMKDEKQVCVTVVASGAGTGLMNFSLGALAKIVNDAQTKLLGLGFEEVR